MTLPDPHSIKTRVILLLRKSPVLSAKVLHERLCKGGKKCTIQAVYKELRSLMAEGIVQKIGGDYAINGTWILQLQAFAAGMAKTCFSEGSTIPVLEPGESQSWNFTSLSDVNDFWAHMALTLVRTMEDKDIYAWNPHLWAFFFQAEKEDRFAKSLRLLGGKFYTVSGHKSFLNLWATQFYKKNDNVVYAWGPGSLRDKMNTDYNVIGDYIISVRLAVKTFQSMEKLFRETTKFENLNINHLTRLLTRDSHCYIKLEHQPRKAAHLRQKIAAFFDE